MNNVIFDQINESLIVALIIFTKFIIALFKIIRPFTFIRKKHK